MSHGDAKTGSNGCEGRKSTIEGLPGRRLAATDSNRGFDDDQQVLKETGHSGLPDKGPRYIWPRKKKVAGDVNTITPQLRTSEGALEHEILRCARLAT